MNAITGAGAPRIDASAGLRMFMDSNLLLNQRNFLGSWTKLRETKRIPIIINQYSFVDAVKRRQFHDITDLCCAAVFPKRLTGVAAFDPPKLET